MVRRAILLQCLVLTAAGGALGAQSSVAQDSAYHALSRLAYGPRPGEVNAVAGGGVMAWIERQLSPSQIDDDRMKDAEARFAILRSSREDLARQYAEAQRARSALQRQGLSEEAMRREMQRRMERGEGNPRRVLVQLQQLHVTRAVRSERQLYEVMVDLWANHFNVFAGKGLDRFLIVSYVEQTIRPRALGKFEDLLIATSQSPAMLFYLDNAQSVAPGSRPPALDRAMRPGRPARPGAFPRELTPEQREQLEARLPRGINENYARELLELHTLGVDGGYSQQDVQEVARIFTGWSIRRPLEGAGFQFNEWAHDRGEKTVLGKRFTAGRGQEEGIELLKYLAHHPATQRHVSHKLCERLVSDRAPDGCVDAAVRAWQRTDGDIREVVRAIVTSPEFWSPGARGAKTKTPLEFVASAVRALGAETDTTPGLAMAVARLGQPLFLQSPPTGYPEAQEDWVNSGALLNRMNVAVALAAGRLPGAVVELDRHFRVERETDELLARLSTLIFGGTLSNRTRTVIAEQVADLEDSAQVRALAVGLALGGPEFQKQ